jgi:CheY-like chemotaxis protein
VAEDSGRSDSINGGIFINYRRVDTGMHARRLYERLTNSFTPSHVFMDVVSIEPGLNFRETIARRFDQCTVLLALISDKWSTGEGQKRRLSDPTDMVRLEIEMALERSLRVIPILFDGAKLPSRRRLPESLRVLHDLQAIEMDSFPLTFSNYFQRLLRALEGLVGKPRDDVIFSPFGSDSIDRLPTGNKDNLVLLVDDDDDIVRMMKTNLLLEGIEVAVAYDGEEALRKVPKLRPNVVLLDVLMPGIDGMAVCEMIREDPENSHTWVIMETSKSLVSDKQLGFAYGADDYITKPFDPAEAVARVKAGLRRSRQLREARRQISRDHPD